MKTLKFSPDLIPLIGNNEKTSTWRLFDDKDLQTGDLLRFLNKETLEEFATAKVIDVYQKRMGDLTPEDLDGHEKFASSKEMYETYSRYYGQTITPDNTIKVINFKLIRR